MTVEINKREKFLLFFVIFQFLVFYGTAQYVIYKENNQDINKTKCPLCDKEKIQVEADRQIYLKLARATKKYCSANWFDGSEVCQHLETECYNYCIKTTEKNCRVECESRI